MKIHPVGGELLNTDGQKYRRTDKDGHDDANGRF